MKILLKLMYLGENYCGWQVQENGKTVQGELCRAFREICGKDVKVTGCSRTDSGVHAKEYFCTAETDGIFGIPCGKLPLAVNAHLDRDISVRSAKEVPKDFHARYDVKYKTYEYVIDNGVTHDPFLEKRSWHVPKKLSETVMDEAAKIFVGEKNFAAFMASGSKVTDTVRRITEASVRREGENVIFRVTGNGFLYNMVRIMTGTLVEVSLGKKSVKDITSALDCGDRKKAGMTAPAEGLYLVSVVY